MSDNTKRAETTEKTNSALLDEMAERVHQVMQVSHGAMVAPSAQSIRGQLEVSLDALAHYPNHQQTHGQISLERMPTNAHEYWVRLNLGILMHFPERSETDG